MGEIDRGYGQNKGSYVFLLFHTNTFSIGLAIKTNPGRWLRKIRLSLPILCLLL